MIDRVVITLPRGTVEYQIRDIAGRGYDTFRTVMLNDADLTVIGRQLEIAHVRHMLEDKARRLAEHERAADRLRQQMNMTGPACWKCQQPTVRSGSCFTCQSCGETTGCG